MCVALFEAYKACERWNCPAHQSLGVTFEGCMLPGVRVLCHTLCFPSHSEQESLGNQETLEILPFFVLLLFSILLL